MYKQKGPPRKPNPSPSTSKERQLASGPFLTDEGNYGKTATGPNGNTANGQAKMKGKP